MAEYGAYDAKLVWAGATVGQVRDIRGPALQQDAIDVTTRDDGGKDTFIGGMRGGGEVVFDLLYDPALTTQTALRAALEAGTVSLAELLTTDTSAARPGGLRFFGTVTKFEPGAPMRDALAADVTVALSNTPAQIDYIVDHAGNYIVDHAGLYLIA